MNLRIKYFAISCLLAITLSIALERRAYAYADPGSSLLLLQSLSAVFTGGLFYFRKRLESLMSKTKDSSPKEKSE